MPKLKSTTEVKRSRVGKVYKITSPSGKIYIGSTIQDIHKRWLCYKSVRCYGQTKILRSLKKYGPESHKFEVVWEGCAKDRLRQERFYGDLFNVLDKDRGLNLKLPGYDDVPAVYSKESRSGFSKARKKSPSFVSKKCQERSVECRSVKVNCYNLDGRFLKTYKSIKAASQDTKVHPFEVKLCCTKLNRSAKGYQFRFNTVDNFCDIASYTKNPSSKRKVVNMHDADGRFIMQFESVKKASEFIGATDMVVYKSCKKGGKLTSYGYSFKLKVNDGQI